MKATDSAQGSTPAEHISGAEAKLPEGVFFLGQDELGILKGPVLAEPSLLPVYMKRPVQDSDSV